MTFSIFSRETVTMLPIICHNQWACRTQKIEQKPWLLCAG